MQRDGGWGGEKRKREGEKWYHDIQKLEINKTTIKKRLFSDMTINGGGGRGSDDKRASRRPRKERRHQQVVEDDEEEGGRSKKKRQAGRSKEK